MPLIFLFNYTVGKYSVVSMPSNPTGCEESRSQFQITVLMYM